MRTSDGRTPIRGTISAEKETGKKGLNAVNVKLARTSGETVRTAVTDANGKFDFGVVPQGSYALTFGRENFSATARTCIVEINGVKSEWDSAKQKARKFQTLSNASRMAEDSWHDFIAVESDGKHPLGGTVTQP